MTIEELERIIICARKNGVNHYRNDEQKLFLTFRERKTKSKLIKQKISSQQMHVQAIPLAQSSVPEVKAEDLMKPMSPLDDLTPEEILYYAVPHYDVIQAEKEEHKKKLDEEQINGG